jgi:hypothetical protein
MLKSYLTTHECAAVAYVAAVAATVIGASAILADANRAKVEPVQPVAAFDFTGIWEVDGKQGNERYDGIVTIRKVRAVYTVQWSIGDNTFVGIGQRTGDVLSVGWAQEQKGGVLRGVTVYQKGRDGTLEGAWVSLPGNGEKHKETLTLLKKLKEKEE